MTATKTAPLKAKLMAPEATVEHAGMMDLIAQVQGAEPDGERVDRVDLGARMAVRKGELMAQHA
jgi:hypothetical protein